MFNDLGAINVSQQYAKRYSNNKDGSFVGSNENTKLDVTYIRGWLNLNKEQQDIIKAKTLCQQLPQENEKDQFDYQIKITTKKVIVTKTREDVSSRLQVYSLIFIPDYIKEGSFQRKSEIVNEEFGFQAENLEKEGALGFVICCTFKNDDENKKFNEFLEDQTFNFGAQKKITGGEISTIIADYLIDIKNNLVGKNIFSICKKFDYSDFKKSEKDIGYVLIPNNIDDLIKINTPKKEEKLELTVDKKEEPKITENRRLTRVTFTFKPSKHDRVFQSTNKPKTDKITNKDKEVDEVMGKSKWDCFGFWNLFNSTEEVIYSDAVLKDDEVAKLLSRKSNAF